MIVGIHQNLEDIINKLKHIQQDIDKNYSEWSIVRENILEEIHLMETKKEILLKENNQHIDISNRKEVELENLLEEIRLMETKKEILLKENNQHIDISNRKEVELEKKRLELYEWEQRCIKREEDLRREIEEERKVSILKNIQCQLKEKVNENELLTKQLKFYKRNIEKYSINNDNISLEITDDNSIKGVKSNTKKDSKRNREEEEEKRLEEEASKRNREEEEKRLEAEEKRLEAEEKRLEAEEKRLEVEASKRNREAEEKRLEAEEKRLEEEASKRNREAEEKRLEEEEKRLEEEEKRLEEEEEKRLEEEAEAEEEGTVVEDFEYKGILYYIDNLSGDIYARLENDEVGDLIGHKDNKGKVKFQKKK